MPTKSKSRSSRSRSRSSQSRSRSSSQARSRSSRGGQSGNSRRRSESGESEEEGLRSLRNLLIHELEDLYDAEKRLIKALPKMAQGASTPDLREAIEMHLEETREHVNRLDQAFQQLGERARGKTCEAMEGLIEEGQDMLKEEGDETVLDAGLIAAAQKVEHYEIASYGCVCTWAKTLGESELAELLGQTLQEEKQADEKLTEIAESSVNVESK